MNGNRGSWCVVLAVLAAAGCQEPGARERAARAGGRALSAAGHTAPTQAPHQRARAVALLDGRVLVADFEPAEIFDPASGTWTPTAPQQHPQRAYNALVRLADGRVLSTGGSGFNASELAEIFDPATGAWTAAAPMTRARWHHALALLADGRVLAAGGLAYYGPQPSETAEIYDPATDTWTPTQPCNGPHADGPAIRLQDGRVLVSGAGQPELFDPATGAFTWVGGPAQARPYGAGALLPDGRVLLFAGDAVTCEIFDPATGAFEPAGAPAEPRRIQAAYATLADGTIAVAGGHDGAGHTLSSVERYDPASGTWAYLTPLLTAREEAAMAPLPGGEALVVGGVYRSPPNVSDQTQVIAPAEAAERIHLGPCQPDTCETRGATCGALADGCGGVLACGACGEGELCSPLHTCACAPTASCGARVCGDIPDGCGAAMSCGTCGAGEECASDGEACIPDRSIAVLDPALHVPACAFERSACDSGELLTGRGPVGPEPNAPNTLGTPCPDGAGGSFHVDESLDRLRISTLDGGPLRARAPVLIEATFYAPEDFAPDALDLWLAPQGPDAGWTHVVTLQPWIPGWQSLTWETVLGRAPLQALRGVYRRGGAIDATCTPSSVDDRDDLVFAVAVPVDTAPPSVEILTPGAGETTVHGTVLLQAAATDDVEVERVEWYVVPDVPDPPPPTSLGAETASPYLVRWNTRSFEEAPSYVIVARALDATGKEAVATRRVTLDNAGPAITIDAPAAGATVTGAVRFAARATDPAGVAAVSFSDQGTLLGTDTQPPYEVTWSAAQATPGTHTLWASATDGLGNESRASVTVVVPGPAVETAGYAADLRAPRCVAAGTSCDSGTLLVGRARLGPEPNAPNTLGGGCADGRGGRFHVDESLDRLQVATATPGASLRSGATVRVTATVWSYAPLDVLDVYYAEDAGAPAWRRVASLPATRSGASELLAATFPLSTTGARQQAVRGVFRFMGTASPCPAGAYDDKDDLVFAVAP